MRGGRMPMKILLRSSPPSLSIAEARTIRANFGSADRLPSTVSRIPLGASGPIDRHAIDFLFDYDIFPPRIIRAVTEWRSEGRTMRAGDIIIQRASLPPFGLGIRAEFAVRVCEIFDDPRRRGFAYETLDGHAERGVSAFYIEDVDGALDFVIHTRSEAGHWLSRLVGPVFTLPFQRWCTRQALEHVRSRFQEENSAGISYDRT